MKSYRQRALRLALRFFLEFISRKWNPFRRMFPSDQCHWTGMLDELKADPCWRGVELHRSAREHPLDCTSGSTYSAMRNVPCWSCCVIHIRCLVFDLILVLFLQSEEGISPHLLV